MDPEKLEAAMPSMSIHPRGRHTSLQDEASLSHSSPGTTLNHEAVEDSSLTSSAGPSTAIGNLTTGTQVLLKPPPIDGAQDWGVKPEPDRPCDPALEEKVKKFHLLKRQGKHFNDSLMQSKAFRNPHIYAKLVQFVDIKETATNFPKDMWDPFDVEKEWYADAIAAKQKEKSEKASAAQVSGQRTRIAFESASSSKGSSNPSSKGKEKVRDREKELDGGGSRYRPYHRDERRDSRGESSRDLWRSDDRRR